MHTPSLPRLITHSATLALATTATHAASITWGAATNINPVGGAASDLDVSTAGTFFGALHFASQATNTTVNGVTFTGIDPGLFTANTITSGNFTLATVNPANTFFSRDSASAAAPYTTLSASYQSLLAGFLSFEVDFPPTMTLTMNNLVAGATYQFEWWSDWSDRTFTVPTTATAGNAVTLQSNPSMLDGGLGQFALGTFVADATRRQDITFTINKNVNSGPNAFQLRQLAPPTVPEPGTALFGLALLGLALARRARK